MARSVDERVVKLRQRYRSAVLANLITDAARWGQPCHAFNVHIEPSGSARQALVAVQDALLAIEPTLLRCPGPTLHISVAWLLAVHVEYPESKAVMWARHGQQWTRQLASIAGRHQSFDLRYRWLAVTDTAVIALAAPTEPVRRLRDDIEAQLSLPEQTHNVADLVHTTLFRFRSTLSNPVGLIQAAEAMDLDVATTATQLTVSEERTFPSLVTATRAKITLDPPSSP